MASDWLADLNRAFKRHRGGRAGWHLQEHRERLRLLSSELPPRPGEPAGTIRKRAITLTTLPGPSTGLQALSEAAAIYDAVQAGTWQWPLAGPAVPDDGRLTGAGVRALAEQFHDRYVGERISEATWQRQWLPVVAKLSQDAEGFQGPPERLLVTFLRRWDANSRARQEAHDIARRLWKVAGWPWPEQARALRGNGKAAADPRGVRSFSDAEISHLRARLEGSRQISPATLNAWDCLIVFGIRPAELIGLELREEGGVLVAHVNRSKRSGGGITGVRTVPAVPPAGWPQDCYGLLQRWDEHGFPSWVTTHRSPGARMSNQLRRMGIAPDLRAYSLRHAFALRLGIELGLHPREAAVLMGHSVQTHIAVYGVRLEGPSLMGKVAKLTAARAI